jgi:ribonuclease HII
MSMSQVPPVESCERCIVVGIDEAGYGPVLGPLVVSAVAFEVPVAIMKELKRPADGPDLWKALRASIAAKPSRRKPRLAVADSKKLYSGCNSERGLVLLERAAMVFLRQASAPPVSLRGLLESVCPGVCKQLDGYPWYAGADVGLPVQCRPDDLATQHNAVAIDLAARGIVFRGLWAEVLPEGQFNERVRATRNKSVVLFGLVTRLLQRVADAVGPRPLRAWIDRQGGRVSYAGPLMTAFEDARLEVVEETPERSSYRLNRPASPWMVRFVEKGETRHLPIALASIYSKYVRELVMICFNRYWAGHVAGLRPTGGYYSDGQRFLGEIEAVLATQGVDRERLVRRV